MPVVVKDTTLIGTRLSYFLLLDHQLKILLYERPKYYLRRIVFLDMKAKKYFCFRASESSLDSEVLWFQTDAPNRLF